MTTAPPSSSFSSKRPETCVALAPTDVTLGEKIGGSIAILIFVTTWIASCFSPALLGYCLWNGKHGGTSFILGTTIVAHFPFWNNQTNAIPNWIHRAIYYYFPRYFQSIRVEFEGKSLPTPPPPTTTTSPPTSGKDDDNDKTDNKEPQEQHQQTFYAIHPHGAFSFGWSSLFCSPHMEHVRFCFAPPLYASPFFRLFARCTGNPGSASKAAMISYMKAGQDVALPPGGFEEATLTSLHHDRVYIKKRTGFVKLCLQHGIPIRPVYVFGEKGLYWNIQGLWNFRIGVLNQKCGMPAIVTWGHPFMPLLPRSNVDVRVVVGTPLVVPKIDNPSREVVQQYHAKYIAALTKLFEDHKEVAYGTEIAKTTKLEIW